eukprot:GHVR01011851.1.p1 GENE.GHVR01011851.1~~GHVR01011851.1.p1  ORF type:complete len:222 (-),score=84.42 GHVR01011851.1:181-846(-)
MLLKPIPNHSETWMAGVFDGHNGGEVAHILATSLPEKLGKYDKLDTQSIEEVCLDIDLDCLSTAPFAGSTAMFGIFRKTQHGVTCVCVCVGDSSCYLIRRDGSLIPLSTSHHPELPTEKERIHRAGGFVASGRVNGQLALSRAFGNKVYKSVPILDARGQAVISLPDIQEVVLEEGDMLLFSTDGVFEGLHKHTQSDAIQLILGDKRIHTHTHTHTHTDAW